MKRHESGHRVVQSGTIRGRDIFLLENGGNGNYLIGPGPNGNYATVLDGDGHFEQAYFKALERGSFRVELDGRDSEAGNPDLGRVQQ